MRSIYRAMYPKVESAILARLSNKWASLHGSEVRDLFLRLHPGFAVDDHAEKLLRELVAAGVIRPNEHPQPTISQAAFFGLKKLKQHPGFVPGCVEHYRFKKAS